MILGIDVAFIHRPRCTGPSLAATFLDPDGIRKQLLQLKAAGKDQ